MRRPLLTTALLLFACSGGTDPDTGPSTGGSGGSGTSTGSGSYSGSTSTRTYDNSGKACLSATGDDVWGQYYQYTTSPVPADLLPDQTAVVTVILAAGISGSAFDKDAVCEALVPSDGVLSVSATGSLKLPATAVSDGNLFSVQCTTPPLAEGSWVLEYAGGSTAFEVPSTGQAPCAP